MARMGWGVEVTSDAIRLCRADFRRGQAEIQRLGEIPVAHGMIRLSLKEGNLSNPGALAEALRQQVRRLGCRGWVRLVLPDSLFLLRTVATDDLPKDRAAARKFLSWQVRDLLPFPADEARLDFLPPVPGTDGRLRVTCLVARTRVMMEYEALMEQVGLRTAVLDAHSVTLAQSASTFLAKKTAGLLSAEGGRATLLVVQEGRPRLWRILPLDPASGGNGVRLIREVADSLAFFQESENVGPLERLLVHGTQSWAAETAAALADWLEIPVSLLDVGGIVPPNEEAGDAAGDLSRWGAAVGAAIRPC
jgi:Tfp pilus assembly PilM family ATPase